MAYLSLYTLLAARAKLNEYIEAEDDTANGIIRHYQQWLDSQIYQIKKQIKEGDERET